MMTYRLFENAFTTVIISVINIFNFLKFVLSNVFHFVWNEILSEVSSNLMRRVFQGLLHTSILFDYFQVLNLGKAFIIYLVEKPIGLLLYLCVYTTVLSEITPLLWDNIGHTWKKILRLIKSGELLEPV